MTKNNEPFKESLLIFESLKKAVAIALEKKSVLCSMQLFGVKMGLRLLGVSWSIRTNQSHDSLLPII